MRSDVVGGIAGFHIFMICIDIKGFSNNAIEFIIPGKLIITVDDHDGA